MFFVADPRFTRLSYRRTCLATQESLTADHFSSDKEGHGSSASSASAHESRQIKRVSAVRTALFWRNWSTTGNREKSGFPSSEYLGHGLLDCYQVVSFISHFKLEGDFGNILEVWRGNDPNRFDVYPLPHGGRLETNLSFGRLSSLPRFPRLPHNNAQRKQKQPCRYAFRPCQEYVPPWGLGLALICILAGVYFAREGTRSRGWLAGLFAFYVVAFAYCIALLIVNGHQNDSHNQNSPTEYRQTFQHDGGNVSQIYLDGLEIENYPSPIQLIALDGRLGKMQMDHAWRTRITVACITITAIFEAAEEGLSHSLHIAVMLSDVGWLHYVPLLLLTIAGASWLSGRMRKPSKIPLSEAEEIVKNMKPNGGKAFILGEMEGCAIELKSRLEALWHHWRSGWAGMQSLDGFQVS